MAIFFRKTRRELEAKRLELDLVERLLAADRSAVDEERTTVEEKLARLQQLLASRVETYPHIAQAWADWEVALTEQEARYLERKKRPAPVAAVAVRQKGRETAEFKRLTPSLTRSSAGVAP